MSHSYLPVCLLQLFSLVWVVSLFLFSLPSLYIIHCLFWVYNGGYFGWLLFIYWSWPGGVGWFYFNLVKIWIFGWSIPKLYYLGLIWIGLLCGLAFFHCCHGDSTWLLLLGFILATFFGGFQTPRWHSQKWAIPCYLNPPSRQSLPPPLQQQRPLLQRQNLECL